MIVIIAVLAVALVALVVLLVTNSLGRTGEDEKESTATTVSTTESATTSEKPSRTETATTTEAPGADIYTTDDWSVTIPDSWEGLYSAKVSADGSTVGFYSTSNKDAGYGGTVVTIVASTESDPPYPSYELLDQDGGTYYYALFPTDVQSDYSDDDLRQEWETMNDSVDELLASFELT